MHIINLILYKKLKEEYKVVGTYRVRSKDISKCIPVNKDNCYDYYQFCEMSDDLKIIERSELYDASSLNDNASTYADFYVECGDQFWQDTIHTFAVKSSQPLDYEQFCNDNYFYKFQIRNKNGESPFYYCGIPTPVENDGMLKRIKECYPECQKFLIFGDYLRVALRQKDVTLDEIKKKKQKRINYRLGNYNL